VDAVSSTRFLVATAVGSASLLSSSSRYDLTAMLSAQLLGSRNGSLTRLAMVDLQERLTYFIAICERSGVSRLQQPVKNMCVEETSIRSRRVSRTTLMMELYPSKCWLSGPVKPIGRCFSSPSPATLETSILHCWSFAVQLSVLRDYNR
jgi:hypothetical protein